MRYYNLRYSRKRMGIHKLEISSRLDRRSNEARGRNHESRWESTNIPCNRGWLIVRYPKVIRFPIELQIKAGEKMAEERYYWRREIMLAAAPIERYLRGERTREREKGRGRDKQCYLHARGYTSNERVSGRYECTSSNKDTTSLIAGLPLPARYRRLALAIFPFFFSTQLARSRSDSLLIESGSFLPDVCDKPQPPSPSLSVKLTNYRK